MTDSSSTLQWWTQPDKDKSDAVFAALAQIKRNQFRRREDDLLHISLYGNTKSSSFGPFSMRNAPARSHARLGLNVVKNMSAAMVSKIAAKNKIRPEFSTFGGDYSAKRRAKGLEKLVQGVFYQQKLYKKQRPIFRDCTIFGPGVLKICTDEQRTQLFYDRIPQWEIHVDDQDAFGGDPRCMYHERYVDKRVAMAMFPEHADEIEKMQFVPIEENYVKSDTTADLVVMVEAWHLPSSKTAGDGRRCIALRGITAVDAEYTDNYFPFAIMRWSEDPLGWYGTGLAYELAGIQAEINSLLLEIQRAHRLIKGHWLVQNGSQVKLRHINDDLAAIVNYSGVMPQYNAPTAIAPDVYQHLWALYSKAYEITGISQLGASSQKPAGLNSGAAIRSYEDIQTERFLEVGTMIEDWTMEVTEQTIDRCREISEASGFRVNSKMRGSPMEEIDFKDVDLPRDSYVLQIFPTSLLPNLPAGRLEFVQEMSQAGLIPPEDALDLVQIPDTEGYLNRRNAPKRIIERNIESIFEKGEWVSPEPFDNHQLAIQMFTEALAEAREDGVDEKNLDLGRRYITLSVQLQKNANVQKPDAMAPDDAQMMMPPGVDPMAQPPMGVQ